MLYACDVYTYICFLTLSLWLHSLYFVKQHKLWCHSGYMRLSKCTIIIAIMINIIITVIIISGSIIPTISTIIIITIALLLLLHNVENTQ